MSLFDYLDQVRSYPEDRRRRILFISTIVITLVIILGWLLNIWLVSGFVPAQEKIKQAAGPGFFDQVAEEFKRVQTGFEAVTGLNGK